MHLAGTLTMHAPRALWYRLAGLAALLAAGLVLAGLTPLGELFTEEGVISLVSQQGYPWWSPLLLIGLYATMAPLGLPTGPLLIGGAAFGAVYGSVYNIAGLLLGAVMAYQAARWLGRGFVLHVTGDRMRRTERLFQRHGFWPLVQVHFLPVPFPVVNFGAALAGVPLSVFMTATVVGIIPSTVIHTYFISELVTTVGYERAVMLVAYAGAFVFFNLLIGTPWIRRQFQRRRRYRELLALRAGRRGHPRSP